ncbi:MAG: hypothetical protein ABSD44_02750 [Terracidiphilus sp.]
MRTTSFLVLLAFLVGGGAMAKAAADPGPLPLSWRPGAAGDLAFESSGFLQRTSYRRPDTVADQFSEDGAYSPVNQAWDKTHAGKWFIEEQRYAFDAIVAGISYHRQDLVARGTKILDWGFRQEGADGSFQCPDSFHSASFFIEAAAHAALLLEASDLRVRNQGWVDAVKPKLHLAALWMMAPDNELPGRARDAAYAHRFYLDADALGETGVLVGDTAMVERSRVYIRAGIERQDRSGFNPEKGGWDTSYHAVGLLFAMNYYTLVADEAMRREMRPMIEKGMLWLKSRVRSDGVVDQTGNTRTGSGQEYGRNDTGKTKTMSYGSAYRAAYYWAMIQGDPSWAQLAEKLYEGQYLEKKYGWRSLNR